MPLPRIFFDANAASDEGGYFLWFDTSRADLARNRDAVVEGARVIIYMPDEFEMEATLRLDESGGFWCADPVPGTIKYLDGSA